MKNLILALAISASNFFELQAQEIVVRWGDISERGMWTGKPEIIGSEGDRYYVLSKRSKRSRTHYFIESLNNENKREWITELDLTGKEGVKPEFKDVKFVNGNLLLFTSGYDESDKKRKAYVSIIGHDGVQKKNWVEIDEIATGDDDFTFSLSYDSTSVIVTHLEENMLRIKVLDSEGNAEWEMNIKSPFPDHNIMITDITSDDSRVYMLANYNEGTIIEPKYKYAILSCEDDKNDADVYEVELDEKFVSQVSFAVTQDNKIVCAGLYSKQKPTGACGIFYQVLSGENWFVESESATDFNYKTLNRFMGGNAIEKDKELSGYVLKELMPQEDGSCIILAEESLWGLSYNHILMARIDEKGELAMAILLPKYQKSDSYVSNNSFAALIHGDDLYLFYNDHVKNAGVTNADELKSQTKNRKSRAMVLVADTKTGAFRKMELLPKKGKFLAVAPKPCLQLVDDELILCLNEKNTEQYTLVKVKIE